MGAKNVKPTPTLPTRAEMLAEIETLSNSYPVVQEGDFTSQDIIREEHITVPIPYMRRIAAADPEHWQMLQVVDKPGLRRWYWVLRRKHPV